MHYLLICTQLMDWFKILSRKDLLRNWRKICSSITNNGKRFGCIKFTEYYFQSFTNLSPQSLRTSFNETIICVVVFFWNMHQMALNFELLEGKLCTFSLSFMSSKNNRILMSRLKICESVTTNSLNKTMLLDCCWTSSGIHITSMQIPCPEQNHHVELDYQQANFNQR